MTIQITVQFYGIWYILHDEIQNQYINKRFAIPKMHEGFENEYFGLVKTMLNFIVVSQAGTLL